MTETRDPAGTTGREETGPDVPGAVLPETGAARSRPCRVGVLTDAAAGLPRTLLERARAAGELICLDLPLMIEGQIFPEAADPRVREHLVLAAAEGRSMSTSRPSPGAVSRALAALAAAGCTEVVALTISGELSGTVQTLRTAARESPIPVRVLDTRTVAAAQAAGVAAALAAARTGADADRVLEAAQAALEATQLLFWVPSLEQLGRSGRVPRALARVGQMLHVKPIATVEQGRLRYLERPRQTGPAVQRFAELVAQRATRAVLADAAARGVPDDHGRAVCLIQDFWGREVPERLHHRIEEQLGGRVRVVRADLPAALAVHTGLGPTAAASIPGHLAGALADPAPDVAGD
ncbi:DegV family protein [Rothia kristinae]|uniref:DegV family EDD domain-containing protein n=1 Tax=Rothia kristinae TaxID=37923 RepID=A0A7T3CFV8_9MICC|nr:DegV family protein [Rothia kristinae]QPT53401.1 DegV family EDD domain-containing protein [Rothia kristinae]